MLLRRFLRGFLWGLLRFNSRWLLVLGRLLYQFEVDGPHNLPSTGPLIIVSRHSSRIEIFKYVFILCTLKKFHGPAAGPDIVNNRVFVWLSRELGMLPARSLSARALRGFYKLLGEGKVIFMMADGEVPWDGRPQPLRPGAAWLALRAHVPVVATLLQGAYDIWPRWASRPHLTGKLVLMIGEPFYVCGAPCSRVTEPMLQEANLRLTRELERLADGYMLRHGATKEGEA
jgi:1-acyl-sn-glycerol-3-phosphate acyltransferase